VTNSSCNIGIIMSFSDSAVSSATAFCVQSNGHYIVDEKAWWVKFINRGSTGCHLCRLQLQRRSSCCWWQTGYKPWTRNNIWICSHPCWAACVKRKERLFNSANACQALSCWNWCWYIVYILQLYEVFSSVFVVALFCCEKMHHFLLTVDLSYYTVL